VRELQVFRQCVSEERTGSDSGAVPSGTGEWSSTCYGLLAAGPAGGTGVWRVEGEHPHMKRGAFLKRLAGTFGLTLSGGLTEKLVGVEVEPVCATCKGSGKVLEIQYAPPGVSFETSDPYLPAFNGPEYIERPCPGCRDSRT